MNDEQLALIFLKSTLKMDWKDTSLTRAPEYEVLKNGGTFFFRNGQGEVYETRANASWIRSYTEEYLDELLTLNKYYGKVMKKKEVQEFLENDALTELLTVSLETEEMARIICATIAALGYNRDWIKELLMPQLMEALKKRF